MRVRQVLSNLVDNALKFTHQGGGVLVSARRDPERPGMLRISVTDDGSGMSEEALERIFDRLHQEPVAHEVGTARRGLGLGLYIARQLVERHGGRIWADSRRGAGSTFHFTLAAWSLADALQPVLSDDRRLRRPGWLQVQIAPRQSGLEAERLAPRIRKELRAILGSGERLLPARSRRTERAASRSCSTPTILPAQISKTALRRPSRGYVSTPTRASRPAGTAGRSRRRATTPRTWRSSWRRSPRGSKRILRKRLKEGPMASLGIDKSTKKILVVDDDRDVLIGSTLGSGTRATRRSSRPTRWPR